MESLAARRWPSRDILIVLVMAILLTGILAAVVLSFQARWLESHSYFYDPATYQLQAARLSIEVQKVGRATPFWREVVHNPTNPLRTLPLIASAPDLLAHPVGHLATALPMLLVFVTLLGVTILHRTRSVPYALGAMFAAVCVPGLIQPKQGMGAYWLDLPAGFLVAAAALALMNSDGLRARRWVATFAVLVSCAALSRYVAGVYAFMACAPLIAYYCARRVWEKERFSVACLQPLALMALIVAVLAGPFVMGHFREITSNYAEFGYGHKSAAGSLQFTIRSILEFMSLWGVRFTPSQAFDFLSSNRYMVLLLAVGSVNIIVATRSSAGLRENLLQWWLPVSVVAFLTASREVGEASYATLYAVPLLLIAALVPAAGARAANPALPVFMGLILTLGGVVSARKAMLMVELQIAKPYAADVAQKRCDVAMAGALQSLQPSSLKWETYFDEYSPLVNLESFYRFGTLPPAIGSDLKFHTHQSYWQTIFRGQTPGQVCETLYANAARELDLAVICEDVTRAASKADNPYTSAAARYFSQKVPSDGRWQREFEVQTPGFGTVVGYRNLRPRASEE